MQKKDPQAAENMDAIIDLWTKMLEADQVHDDTIVSNVELMQQRADNAVKILRENLKKLHAIALTAVMGARTSSFLPGTRTHLSRRLDVPVFSCGGPNMLCIPTCPI